MVSVLHVNKLYPPHVGGVEEMARNLAEGLSARSDFESRVLVCNEGLRTRREMLGGVEVTRVGSLGRLRSEPLAPAFPLHLLARRADIYQFHTPFPLGELSGLMLAKGSRIATWYHSDVVRQRWILPAYRPVLRRFLSRSRAIMVSSPHLLESSEVLASLADRCRVVRFGVELDRFLIDDGIAARSAEIRERYAAGGGLILFIGRLVYYKGLTCLMEAMREVEAGLLVLGRGPLRGDLEEATREAGLGGRIHFVEWAAEEDLPAYYHACDLLVLPSTARSEAFGLVLLEAQACGKPVISTELGTGTSYANLDGETGLVVPPGDVGALAGSMNLLLRDEGLRERMGERGRRRVEEQFSLAGMIDRVAEIYMEIMEE